MKTRVLTAITLLLAVAPRGWASGFQLREQGAAGEGEAFAGSSAGAHDLSDMFFNPAVLPLFKGGQVSLGGSWIGVRMDLSGAVASRGPGFQPGDQPIAGPTDLPNAVSQPILPTLYAAYALNDRVSVGLSVNVPFGLVTNYPQDFIGRYYAYRTDLKTYDIAPTIAFRAGETWTFGASFVARRAEATISNAVDFGAIGNASGIPGYIPGSSDVVATLSGSAWAYGYKLGFTWQPSPDFRLGGGYQGKTNLDIKGAVTYGPQPAVPAPLNSIFKDSGAATTVDLPDTATAGFTWSVTPKLSFQGEVQYTGWSTFKQLNVTFASGQPNDLTQENWKSTMFYSLGATYKVSDAWAWKAGLAYDRSPVDDAFRTPRIPDADRTWVSMGFTWSPSKTVAVDVGATEIFAPSVPINLYSGTVPTNPNYFRGNLSGTYKVGATILSASIKFLF